MLEHPRRALPFVVSLTLAGVVAHPSRGDVMFDFLFGASGAPGGFFDATSGPGMANLAALADVADYIGGTIGGDAVISVDVSTFADAGDSTLASAGGFFYAPTLDPAMSGVIPNAVQEEILMGGSPPGGGSHAFMMVNTAKSYYVGSDPGGIGATENDLRSVFLHELTHALGWASAVKSDGSSGLTDAFVASDPTTYAGLGEVYTIYDTLLVDTADLPVIVPPGEFNPASDPGMGILISGTESEMVAGGSIPLVVTPFTFDATHIAPIPSIDTVMKAGLPDGVILREWTPIDLAVLTDLGYTIVPEPGVGALVLLALAGVARRRRRR